MSSNTVSLVSDEDLLREISTMFLEECPRMLEEIQAAIDGGDAVLVHRIAHNLKGLVSNFGAETAYEIAVKIENMGRSAQLNDAQDELSC
jgi:two-component system sensor histidine kinase/response regulator